MNAELHRRDLMKGGSLSDLSAVTGQKREATPLPRNDFGRTALFRSESVDSLTPDQAGALDDRMLAIWHRQ